MPYESWTGVLQVQPSSEIFDNIFFRMLYLSFKVTVCFKDQEIILKVNRLQQRNKLLLNTENLKAPILSFRN